MSKNKKEVSRESQLVNSADQEYLKLESYYNIGSNSCAMCLILDPQFKLTWLTQHDLLQEDDRNSDTEQIDHKDEALKHLREVYAEYCSEFAIKISQDPQVSETSSVTGALGQKARVAWHSGIKSSLGRLQKDKRDKVE
ncbi:hypothetical protein O181_040135 [Austropuccinia psidii MF-1]|uniref:Uncharacterized protein n=1 Tax=Austropuccinia psidii MF-1 TaxID=1389203 RepID=A0A9Q3DG54_9BASI|nr:hypothetical protein [Austropuccinia psidii MF-1]